jgi:hypothetical protein|tara:strand:- start:10437 stop:10673 length:237 start_codon:yes stop_codon:yes gene_type:complete
VRKSLRKKLAKDVDVLKDVGEKNLADKVKKNWTNNIKGAIIGGGAGVIIALKTGKNPLTLGVIGLIVGRIIFNFNNKK